ncbi:glycosyltransferase [Halopseudomonas pachastrellae]|nr:glycosyltransferase [Halopseudomonas pachastrellae]
MLTFDNYITPSTVMLRRSMLDDMRLSEGVYAQEGMLAGDWELWIRVARHNPDFAFVRRASVGYRIHGNQVSQDFYRSERPLWEHLHILELNLADAQVKPRLQAAAERVVGVGGGALSRFSAEVLDKYREDIDRVRGALFGYAAAADTDQCLFSIILTTYNRPAMLVDALRSVAAQTLRDFEVILVNDHGEPVEALLKEFDFPLTYLYQGRNQGLSAARNAGLALARGRYACYLDDDDFYAPQHLETLAGAFEKAGDAVVYTGVEYVAERVEDGVRVELSRQVPFEHEHYDRERLFIHNYIPVNTWAHPRALLQGVGQFDTGLTAFEDWDLLLRLAARYPLVHVPEVTAEVRTRKGGSDGDDHMLSRERERFASLYQEMYRRHSDLGSERVRKGRAVQLRSLGVVAKGDPTPVRTWLSARKLTAPQQRLATDYVTAHRDESARLTVILLDLDGDAALRQQSLDSLAVQVDAGNIAMQVMSLDAAPADSAVAWTQCSGQGWPAQLNATARPARLRLGDAVAGRGRAVASGLQMLSLELLANPDCRAIFADALFRQDGSDYGAALRPDFNLDYLLSFPRGLSANWLFRREALLSLGGFAEDAHEIIELDAILRLINQQGGIGLGHVPEPLVLSDAPVLSDSAAERTAVLRHVQARGYEHAQVQAVRPGQYRVDYGHVEQPLVSVVVIVQDQMAAAQRCVMSLLEHTRYPHYEILLIDNASEQDATREWLQSVEGMGSERLKVLRTPERLTNSDLCNQAALNAQGEYLLLLRAEVAVLDAGWLDALMNHALRPEVGAVGPRLVDSDGKITHAGLVLGLRGPASSPFVGEAADAPGYMQRLQVDHNPAPSAMPVCWCASLSTLSWVGWTRAPWMARRR